ncbi:hypothetical protein L6E12_21855 [Actinokineospora sp. PR83]|uniref:hypothetical protein n=1 Tax=Actinokineospora sp. PR83 TaxID=2884908 RepID=UPI0027DFF756|nr:hypothetical protein [Actinokineospora sp. PR83]MCG8918431.1 hypothetical protein [Actinokineospora sp. PR83]
MSLDALLRRALAGELGPDPADQRVSVGFTTRQGVRHPGRDGGYRNEVVSLRVGAAVGSCAVEPGRITDDAVFECVGRPVAELLEHADRAVRVAALDAYLMGVRPHADVAETITVPAGDSLTKSLHRAETVVDLLGPVTGQRVLVVGVVNSLLHHLRLRRVDYTPCDRKGGTTEWGEPILRDAAKGLTDCDAILASGMTLGDDGVDLLLDHARATGVPLVFFAQTGSAVLPWFIGDGATAVSAEPYPFFWLDGGPTPIHRYRAVPA